MGADFMLYCCEEPSDYAKAYPVIMYRIESLSDGELADIADELLWYDVQEIEDELEDFKIKEEDLYSLDDLKRNKIRKMAREKLVEAVHELIGNPNDKNICTGWRRDVTNMHLNGVSYIFSGGMSWGDLPAEACEFINLIDHSGIFCGMGDPNFDYESFKC